MSIRITESKSNSKSNSNSTTNTKENKTMTKTSKRTAEQQEALNKFNEETKSNDVVLTPEVNNFGKRNYSDEEAAECAERGFRHEDGTFVQDGFPFSKFLDCVKEGKCGPHWNDNVKLVDFGNMQVRMFTTGNGLYLIGDESKKFDSGNYKCHRITAEEGRNNGMWFNGYKGAIGLLNQSFTLVEQGLHLRVTEDKIADTLISTSAGEISRQYKGDNKVFQKFVEEMKKNDEFIVHLQVKAGKLMMGGKIEAPEITDDHFWSERENKDNKAYYHFVLVDMIATYGNVAFIADSSRGTFAMHSKMAVMLHYATPVERAEFYNRKGSENAARRVIAKEHFIQKQDEVKYEEKVERKLEKAGLEKPALPLFGNPGVMVVLEENTQYMVFRGSLPKTRVAVNTPADAQAVYAAYNGAGWSVQPFGK